ncbi:MAG: BMP family ABC transporter substrate-binding protein [Oscillospiraceae bacterium]|nr:BMP family ABC transporter substrate-binding protein [Oscillospiraceae bacterium]
MKKRLIVLIVVLSLLLAACAQPQQAPAPAPTPPADGGAAADTAPPAGEGGLTFGNIRLAFVHVGDPADMGYTYRQHRGTTDMMLELGIHPDQVLNFFNIPPGGAADTAILEAIEWGADMVFATSFGHGPHMLEAARAHPDVNFFHATGDLALDAGLPNFHNYFGNMSQARYLSGIAAGLRTETNVLGFVAAHPFAEVITGFTAFYKGALSVNPDVTMYVMFMNAWNNPALEAQIAQALIDRGADVIGQHADSPSAQGVAQNNGVWSVGYNANMIPAAPGAVLVSPMFDWSYYLTYAVYEFVTNGNVRTDFLGSMEPGGQGMVFLSALNPNEGVVAEGTAEAIAAAEGAIIAGRNIFTGPIYDNEGNQILAEGEEWTERQSAPSWSYIVQGITVIE